MRSKPPKKSRIGMVSPTDEDEFSRGKEAGRDAVCTSDGGTVHDLEFRDRLALVVLVGWGASRLSPNDGEFHVLDLYTDEEEVDLSDNDVLEMIPKASVSTASSIVKEVELTWTCCTQIRYEGSPRYQLPS